MSKRAHPQATAHQVLQPIRTHCPSCGRRMWSSYRDERVLITLGDIVHLRLPIHRCPNAACPRYHRPYRPEAEGRLALPKHEFGLDAVALIGALRYQGHQSVPEIHRTLRGRGVAVSERSVTHLLERYDELVALTVADIERRQVMFAEQGRVILALDGLQPDVGHEVLWVLREVLSGEVLLARSLLSATETDLTALLQEATAALPVPVVGVISDGQHSIRHAVAKALPGVVHQLCQFHYLREAAKPVYEADRHAKKELKKSVRGIRPLERTVEGREDEQARIVQGYCAAVRSALTDDGRPPLEASGLKLHERLSAIAESLERAAEKGGCRRH
jgi:Transposase, Mutator family